METALIICAIALAGLLRGTDVFTAMTEGAAEGLRTVARIFPSLVALLTAVYMLRASGLTSLLCSLTEPLLRLVGLPPETGIIMLLRPISGGGALAAAAELIMEHGADSYVGRVAAVMLGSTETTFYVISIYFGSLGIKKTRWAIPAAFCADLTGFFMSALTVNLLF